MKRSASATSSTEHSVRLRVVSFYGAIVLASVCGALSVAYSVKLLIGQRDHLLRNAMRLCAFEPRVSESIGRSTGSYATQGFTKRWDTAESCNQAWTEIHRIAFGNASQSVSQRVAVYYDDVPGPDLGLVRASSGELQIPAANAGRLTQHLKTLSKTDRDDTVWRL